MTQDDIIRLAREAGIGGGTLFLSSSAFAIFTESLMQCYRAREREAVERERDAITEFANREHDRVTAWARRSDQREMDQAFGAHNSIERVLDAIAMRSKA